MKINLINKQNWKKNCLNDFFSSFFVLYYFIDINDLINKDCEVKQMIKYECNNCNNLICDTSICPVCKERTYVSESIIYYCDHCHTPLYDEICPLCNETARYLGTDVRPVFPE